MDLSSFDFCIGSEDESPVENLGQVLFGERIRPSPYKVCPFIHVSCLCNRGYENESKWKYICLPSDLFPGGAKVFESVHSQVHWIER